MGLVFAGYDFDDRVSPYKAGVGFTLAADKPEAFLGKAALLRGRDHGSWVLLGLDLEGNEAVGHGDRVHFGRSQVGVLTSTTRGHQKRLPAAVVRIPLYDPEKVASAFLEPMPRGCIASRQRPCAEQTR